MDSEETRLREELAEAGRTFLAAGQRLADERNTATARATAAESALAEARQQIEQLSGDVRAAAADYTSEREITAAQALALAEARGALRGVLKLLEDGALVRDTSHDHESGWALKQMGLVVALKRASAAAEENP